MPGEDVYDDEHRIFLQGLMSKGILSFKVSYLKSVLRSRSRYFLVEARAGVKM